MQLDISNIGYAVVSQLIEEKNRVLQECEPSKALTLSKVIESMIEEKLAKLEEAKQKASETGDFKTFSLINSDLREAEKLLNK
jgi:ethanolamine utilization microcompartment shell protein EutS